MSTDATLDSVLAQLRANGRRVTSPRRAILQAMIGHRGHPTAEELTADVNRLQPDVDKSTVYRFLDELEQLGIIDHVHLGHGPAVYHFGDQSHHHLVCEACGTVVEVPIEAFLNLRKRLQADFGFALSARHFAVSGTCKGCAGDDEALSVPSR